MYKSIRFILLGSLAGLPFLLPISVAIHSLTGFNSSGMVLQLLALVVFGIAVLRAMLRRQDIPAGMSKDLILLFCAMFVLSVGLSSVQSFSNDISLPAIISAGFHYILPIVLFGGAYLVVRYSGELQQNKQTFLKIIISSFGLVAIFALLQYFILPKDVLNVLGYERVGIRAFQYVGSNANDLRVISTTAGPNALGIYAAFMAPILYVGFSSLKNNWKKLTLVLLTITPLVIYVSKSRTGMVSFMVGMAVFIWSMRKTLLLRVTLLSSRMKTLLSVFGAVLLVCLCFVLYQGTINRAENSLINSDSQRLESLRVAWEGFTEKPFGHGLGTAGIGSYYNPEGPTIIENYHLQIVYELGAVGLLAWLLLLVILAVACLRLKNIILRSVSLSLLAIVIVSNLFLPALADILLATIPWLVIGYAVGGGMKSIKPHAIITT